jgi:uncharacterized protein YjbI with pentapeptide repeats
MDPAVESALISAAATIVGVGGTVIVAFLGFKSTRAANDAALAAAREATKETLDATRAGQLADRYTRAIDQLGSSTVDVTIGGIYALERIARDSPEDYHPTVMEVLAACIRENSKKPLQEQAVGAREPGSPESFIRPDIQAAMTVIGRRDTKHDLRQINLRGVHLPFADLPSAHLSGVDLTYAHLAQAKLGGAKLGRVDQADQDFPSYAVLMDADLSGADLRGADLSGADLRGAHLNYADLRGGILRSAVLGADLSGADLSGADLSDAVLDAADLRDAKFGGAVLSGARWCEHVPVPEGWELDTGSGRLRRVATGSESAESN